MRSGPPLYIDVTGFFDSFFGRVSRRWQTLSSESAKEGKIRYIMRRKTAGATGPKAQRKNGF